MLSVNGSIWSQEEEDFYIEIFILFPLYTKYYISWSHKYKHSAWEKENQHSFARACCTVGIDG